MHRPRFESDTETNPDKGRDGNLSCYRFMKDDKETPAMRI